MVFRLLLLFIILGCALSVSGCVERSYLIETVPAGADIFIDGEPVGPSPVDVEFDFYISRRVRIEMDGFHTETTELKLIPPAYEYFPFDFVSENVIPFTLQDRHILHVELTARTPIPEEKKEKLIHDLQERAKDLRQQAD